MTGLETADALVERVSQLLHTRIGLRADLAVRGRLARCVRDDVARHAGDLDSYFQALLSDGQALQSLLNRVTVQETGFFRHPEHFDVLARDVLHNATSPVTIWSAGCANGQEAFSLAMVAAELDISGSVIATDLSTDALRRTDAARYTARELNGLSPQRVARHLTRNGEAWEMKPAIRARVRTIRHNLMDPVPDQLRGAQIVFCRNVLIYFSAGHAAALLERIAEALPESWLFLGAAESMWQLSERFQTVAAGDTFSYRPRPRPMPPTTIAPRTPIRPVAATTAVPAVGRMRRSAATTTDRDNHIAAASELAEVGQRASAAGDARAAVVAFRKCVYLNPDDPMAHLHLGLVLETGGDQPAARRSFSAARSVLLRTDRDSIARAVEGYTFADLLKLLDTKLQAAPR